MGYLKEKYTESYYTGINKKGERLSYGVTNSFDEQGVLTLREHDALILGQINFHNKNVLSLGCKIGMY